MKNTISNFLLILCFFISFSAFAESPEWCGNGSYSQSHPLAWERFSGSVEILIEENRIRDAYTLIIEALDTEMMSQPQSSEKAVVKEALHQYLNYILKPEHNEAPAIFLSGPPNPLATPPILQYQLGPLGEGAPIQFMVTIPCPSLVAGVDPSLRNIAHALWSMHKVGTTGNFSTGLKLASLQSTELYETYEDYTMNGLPMWPWEMWVNGYLVPENFNQPAPKRQWVFLRPNVAPALVTGSEEEAELDYGLTLEIGHIWYRTEDYSSWWGLSGMVALTDDEGVGYGGLLRWNDYTIGAANHSKNDNTLVYVSIDLYKLVTGEQSRVNSAQGFLDAVLNQD